MNQFTDIEPPEFSNAAHNILKQFQFEWGKIAILQVRVPGFGPGLKAWEAFVLPLHYTRCKQENFSAYFNLS